MELFTVVRARLAGAVRETRCGAPDTTTIYQFTLPAIILRVDETYDHMGYSPRDSKVMSY